MSRCVIPNRCGAELIFSHGYIYHLSFYPQALKQTQTLSQGLKGNLSVTMDVFSLMDMELVHLHKGISIKKMSLHSDL